MAYDYDKELMECYHLWVAWNEWYSQRPSLKHPIQYIKWLRSEPKYRKEKNK
jgi:hypothetical protein